MALLLCVENLRKQERKPSNLSILLQLKLHLWAGSLNENMTLNLGRPGKGTTTASNWASDLDHPVCKWMEFTLLLHAGTTQCPFECTGSPLSLIIHPWGWFPAGRICDLDSLTCDFFLKDFLLLIICLCLSVYGYVHRLQMHWKTSDLRGHVITHSCEPPDGLLGTDLWFSVKAVWILLLSHPFSPCGHLLFLFSQ